MLSFRLKGRWTTPQSTLSEHRVISSLFNVVIQTQRQMDPPSQHCQSTEWSLHCSMLSSRLIGRWTPPKTLSEHRVISSLFNVVIQTQRQINPLVNIIWEESYLFTVQCCHSDSKADGHPSQHCQRTEWSLHCSMLPLRLKGRWTPSEHSQSTEWSLHCSMLSFRLTRSWHAYVQNTVRAQSDLFTVQCCHPDSKAGEPPHSTLSEHRVIC